MEILPNMEKLYILDGIKKIRPFELKLIKPCAPMATFLDTLTDTPAEYAGVRRLMETKGLTLYVSGATYAK